MPTQTEKLMQMKEVFTNSRREIDKLEGQRTEQFALLKKLGFDDAESAQREVKKLMLEIDALDKKVDTETPQVAEKLGMS